MTPAQIERIMEPFMQADSSTTRNYGGTGLGLAITKNIVELMGGKLTVHSIPGSGSTFSFEITLATMDASDDELEYTKLEVIEKPQLDGLILLCEDNAMNQQVMCRHLENVGLRTVIADNGKIGVDKVRERVQNGEPPFDLILMDIFMPVMDGIDAATKIAALGTGTPIIAVTANIITSELEKYKKHGMPDYLGKPFASQELWRILIKYLAQKSSVKTSPDKKVQVYDEMEKELRISFVKSNRVKYDEIAEALKSGDFTHAHRLAHSLKGNAGFVGKPKLVKAAAEIETLLTGHSGSEAPSIPDEILSRLKTELDLVLKEFAPLFDEFNSRETRSPLSGEQILALFEKLEPMLRERDTDCLDLLDDILAIPGAESLAKHIEKCEFKSAANALDELKKKCGVNHG